MEELKNYPISFQEAARARDLVRQYIKPTQLIPYEGLSKLIGTEILVKHENHNPTGTFKIRGGVTLMHHLCRHGIKGVITFSTGNHGLSIATAAKWFGIEATVVVPEHNNPTKNRAITDCGATLIEAGTTFEEASKTVEKLCQEQQLYYAHPADEPLLINGVGTAFLEVIEECPDIDVMVVPLGAGSEAAAAITVLRSVNKNIDIIAVQAESSSAAYDSWKKKEICHSSNTTFAGGFATGMAYDVPFEIYKNGLSDFVKLTEQEIYEAIGCAFYYTHNLAEGAGASTIMAAYKIREQLKGKTVVLQMSGCNASPDEIIQASQLDTFRDGIK